MTESEIYIAVSNYLKIRGWELLGGQPPSGTDHLPVIEIKDPDFDGKGSKGSVKPDLIARKNQILLLIELKPRFSKSDREKLLTLLSQPRRINALWTEMKQRGIVLQAETDIDEFALTAKVRGALGYSGPSGTLHGLLGIRVDEMGAVFIECQPS